MLWLIPESNAAPSSPKAGSCRVGGHLLKTAFWPRSAQMRVGHVSCHDVVPHGRHPGSSRSIEVHQPTISLHPLWSSGDAHVGATSHHVGSRLESLFDLRWGDMLKCVQSSPGRTCNDALCPQKEQTNANHIMPPQRICCHQLRKRTAQKCKLQRKQLCVVSEGDAQGCKIRLLILA